MFDFFIEYMNLLITRGWDFFEVVLPLGIIYFVFTRIREIYRDGYALWVTISTAATLISLGSATYIIFQGWPWWLGAIVGVAGSMLGLNFSERFMPKKRDKDGE